MSRARVHEVSSPISLFPFIGILLCTMAALLVILIAVSRSARDTAEQQVASRRQTAASPQNVEARKKIRKLNTYVSKLKQMEGDAQRALREDQLRLSHVEDHIRRLQEKLRSAQMAGLELAALEEEHYDDRQQAEREAARLRQLISESEETIADLREQVGKGKRSYALMPYEGPNGTYRRPIYIECVRNVLILQPEGVEISSEELREPLGPGNPLAASLRAAREHLVQIYPKEGKSRDTEPYPLLLVRPSGLMMYNRARRAIDDGDFDFGYELVEEDWKLKYPTANPALAAIEQQAIEQACARQELLAAAAPRAYRNPMLAAAGEFDDAQDEPAEGATGAYVIVRRPGTGGYGSDGLTGGSAAGGGGGSGTGNGSGVVASSYGGESDGVGTDANGSGNNSGENLGQGGAAGASGEEGGNAQEGPGGPAANGYAAGGSPTARPPMGGQHGAGMVSNSPEGGVGMPPDGSGQPPSAVSVMTGSPPSVANDPHSERKQFQPRGKDWALGKKSARAVPVQRSISVVVREDQLAILPDSGRANARGEAIPMKGDTVEAMDAFVAQVRKEVDGWGIAGDGLYWRPILLLNVGPNAERRASDLRRLLKNSGLEIRSAETARNIPQGETHETR